MRRRFGPRAIFRVTNQLILQLKRTELIEPVGPGLHGCSDAARCCNFKSPLDARTKPQRPDDRARRDRVRRGCPRYVAGACTHLSLKERKSSWRPSTCDVGVKIRCDTMPSFLEQPVGTVARTGIQVRCCLKYSLLVARGALAALALLTPAVLRADAADPPALQHVLLLHQAGGSATFRGRFDVAFVDAMRSGYPSSIDLFEESIDSVRFPGAEQARIARTYLEHKYKGRSIDVIVATGMNPFTFANENRTLFGNPPIVAIVAPTGPLTSSHNATGPQWGGWHAGSSPLARAPRPSTDRVYVVDGARENSSYAQVEFNRQLTQNFPSLQLVYLRDLPLSDVVSQLSTAPERSIVFFVRQSMQTQTQDVDEFAALARIVAASPVPVFSHLTEYLGHGIVGGSIWQFETDARRLAEMAKQIANGASVSSIRTEPATYAGMLDWNQLQRWGISESLVPPGTQILFQKLSFFQRNRPYVLGGLALVLAQAMMIATLWIQRALRREIEARNLAI